MESLVYSVMELMDSDSEDEEADALLCQFGVQLVRSDRNRVPTYYENVVGRYYEFEFKRLFRLSRDTSERLATRFEHSPFFPKPHGGRPQIPAGKTCLIALSYLGSQTSMYKIADTFDVSESSVSLCLRRILQFLFSISAEIIRWPTGAEREACKAGFLTRSKGKGPRSTFGCVDGCHIEILKPKESPASYFNRKKFPSIILQGICDSKSRLIDVFVGFPGSAHDSRVLANSTFFDDAEEKCGGDYMLGDAAYPLLSWLLTLYRDCGPTSEPFKTRFNKRLSQQRVAIEHTFGMLKQRFRRLYFIDADTIDRCCLVILGACVLHNMCLESIDDLRNFSDTSVNSSDIENEDDFQVSTTAAIREACELRRKRITETQC
ncbi:hypothetical protein MTO96_034497 [Rhipicephalus appendiculatus]